MTLFTNPTLSTSSHYNAGTWPITPSAAIFNPGSSEQQLRDHVCQRPHRFYRQPGELIGSTDPSVVATKVYDGTTRDTITDTVAATLSGTLCSYQNRLTMKSKPPAAAQFHRPQCRQQQAGELQRLHAQRDRRRRLQELSQPPINPAATTITQAVLIINVPRGTERDLRLWWHEREFKHSAFTVPPGQLFGSDTVTSVSLTIDTPKWSSSSNYDAGNYSMTPSANGSGLTNYLISCVPSSIQLTVAQAPLTVTADNRSKSYGADNSSVVYGYSITGFVTGDFQEQSEVQGGPTYRRI